VLRNFTLEILKESEAESVKDEKEKKTLKTKNRQIFMFYRRYSLFFSVEAEKKRLKRNCFFRKKPKQYKVS